LIVRRSLARQCIANLLKATIEQQIQFALILLFTIFNGRNSLNNSLASPKTSDWGYQTFLVRLAVLIAES